MGQTTGQIEQHINEQRDELGHNITELEDKVKATFDWRRQTRARPYTALGIAFGVGAALAVALPSRRSAARALDRFQERRSYSSEHASTPTMRYEKRRASDAWEKIKSALFGVVITRVQDLLDEVIPGFREEFFKTDARGSNSATHKTPELAESVYRQKVDGHTDWPSNS